MYKRQELGNSFLDICNLESAKIAFEKAKSFDPASIKVHMGLEKCEIFRPISEKDLVPYDAERAIKMLNVILKENPNAKHAYLFLAKLYHKIDPKIALTYYEKVISLNPKSDADSLPYNGLEYIYESEKKYEHAFMWMKEAENLCGWDPLVTNNLAYQYLMKGRYEELLNTLSAF